MPVLPSVSATSSSHPLEIAKDRVSQVKSEKADQVMYSINPTMYDVAAALAAVLQRAGLSWDPSWDRAETVGPRLLRYKKVQQAVAMVRTLGMKKSGGSGGYVLKGAVRE